MASLEDDEDSADGSSDNDVDETMEDVDEGDADAGGDADADAENEDDNDDNEEDEDQEDGQDDLDDSPSRSFSGTQAVKTQTTPLRSPLGNGHEPNADNDSSELDADTRLPPHEKQRASGSPQYTGPQLPYRPSIRPAALTAITYDIVPTIAAPHSTSINTVTATPDMRWVFSGGSDGYIRKFNWVDTANAKAMLTVAQRHPFVDSVTKAGVLISYWENEESPDPPPQNPEESGPLSPVYSLAVHHQALWLLSGLESGAIKLQTVRHQEGTQITALRKHTSPVSVMVLGRDEKSFLSGSWDKTIIDWDLDSGRVKRLFSGSGAQIAAIEMRPESSLPVPREVELQLNTSDTFASDSAAIPNGINHEDISGTQAVERDAEDAQGSPDFESLFGDDNYEGGNINVTDPNFDADADDDVFGPISDVPNGIETQNKLDVDGDIDMSLNADHLPSEQSPKHVGPSGDLKPETASEDASIPVTEGRPTNGIPHAEDLNDEHSQTIAASESTLADTATDNVFLDAAMDGTLRIWDKRQSNPISKIVPSRSVPPWCMNACWSHDGNYIYAGRRNGTVEEYSLHKRLRAPNRTFKFPAGSGAVSAVRAMPNGIHLVCASYDILRLYDLREQDATKHSLVPFLIVPGHQTGVVSQLYVDPSCTFMITTAGTRGWEGNSKEVLLGYEIGIGN